MATFTMTVADIMGDDYDTDVSVLGLHDYPIFDPSYRHILNEKIVMRYWTREIGYETTSLFKHHMRRKMHEIMPYYNQLFETTRLKFDPFETINIGTVSTGEGTADSEATASSSASNTSTADSTARAVHSETPQTRLANHEDYATSMDDSNSQSTTDAESKGQESQKQGSKQAQKNESKTTGTQGPKGVLLAQFRETIINVDLMILDDLDDQFMQVYGDHSSYTQSHMFPYMYPYF